MEKKLERRYGLFTAICMVVGTVIGSGVFFKAQNVLTATNGDMPLGIAAWVITGLLMIICSAMFSVMATKYEKVSGVVDYAEAACGPTYGYYLAWFMVNIYYPAMTGVLARHNIDMRALSLAETKDFGIVRIIVDNLYDAATVLKDAGYIHSITPVLGVAIPDTPGGLNKVLQVLTDARVNVEYMYAFLGGKDTEHAYMIFRVEDPAAATAALASRGISVVEQEEIESI